MTRTLTSSAQTKVDTNIATEPIIIIKIEWDSGTLYYADKAITVGAITADGSILSMGDISSQQTGDNAAEFSSVGVLLDDTDGGLKVLVNTEVLEGKLATVYQHFAGNTDSDLVTLLKGRISGDIRWSEGDQSLAFDIETAIENEIVGFSATATEVPTIHKDAVDKPWPMVFGTALKVPALKLVSPATGKTKTLMDFGATLVYVEGGNDFPQSTSLQVQIGNVLYTGAFNGELFTASSSNDPYYEDVVVADRNWEDKDGSNASVFWVEDAGTYLQGRFILIWDKNEGWMVNLVTAQYGTKCFCKQYWSASQAGELYKKVLIGYNKDSGQNHIINEARGMPSGSWPTQMIERTYGPETNYFGMSVQSNNIEVWQTWGSYNIGWAISVGANVVQTEVVPVYIANLFPTSSISQIWGTRSVGGEDRFVPIPSRYYTKNLSSSVGGQTCCNVEFPYPLELVNGEGWKGDVYVSLTSTVGPNSATVIKYLIDNYSNLGSDSSSFDSVATSVTNYPCGFAILDKNWNTVALCEEIAWQSRCALLIRNNTVFIKYLSAIPTADFTATADHVEHRTMMLGFTPIEEVLTKIKSTWRLDYSGQDRAVNELSYSNNISAYGLHEVEYDFFIYNRGKLVDISMHFWGYRKSNLWRMVDIVSFLKVLKLETYDCLAYNIPIISTNTLRGLIVDTAQNTENDGISISTQLASKAGQHTAGQPVEDLNFYTGDPAQPVVADPGTSNPIDNTEETDYDPVTTTNVIPSGTTTDPDRSGNYIVIVNDPTEVIRGETFALQVELRTAEGSIVYANVSATVILTSTDRLDILSVGYIQLVNGSYLGDVTIDGGDGDKTGSLKASAAGYTSRAVDPSFPIRDKLAVLIITVPEFVRRGVDFTVGVTDGVASEDLEVTKVFSDENDELYLSATPITQITLDGSGEYDSTAWQVDDGDGNSDWLYILLSDVPGVTKHEAAISSRIKISDPVGPFDIVENLYFNDSGSADVAYFVLATNVVTTYERTTEYNLTVTAYTSAGVIDTSYVPAGDLDITLTDKSDASDAPTPTTISNTGWSGGAKTITNFSVDGGDGSDTATLVVTDPTGGRTGSLAMSIENVATIVSLGSGSKSASGSGYYNGYPLTDDTDPVAVQAFADTQTDAIAALESAVFNSGVASYLRIGIYDTGSTYCTYSASEIVALNVYNIPSALRASATYAYLKFAAAPNKWKGTGPLLHADYTLNFKFTENIGDYTVGGDIKAATPDFTVSGTALYNQCGEIVWNSSTGTLLITGSLYELEIPLSLISAMTQDSQGLLTWWSTTTPVLSFQSTWQNQGVRTGHEMLLNRYHYSFEFGIRT